MEEKAMSLNYRINGEVSSFKSKEDLASHLRAVIPIMKESLKVEPLYQSGPSFHYDHMQEILDLCYEALAYVKGIRVMADAIQEHGRFVTCSPDDIEELSLQVGKIMEDIYEIAAAASNVYEVNWKLREEEKEAAFQARRSKS